MPLILSPARLCTSLPADFHMKVKGKNSEVGPRITKNSQFHGKYNRFPKLSIEAAADVAVFETACCLAG